jgi:hypothetical protein
LLAVIPYENAVPTVPVAVVALLITGGFTAGAAIVSVSVALPVPPALLALIPTLNVPLIAAPCQKVAGVGGAVERRGFPGAEIRRRGRHAARGRGQQHAAFLPADPRSGADRLVRVLLDDLLRGHAHARAGARIQ